MDLDYNKRDCLFDNMKVLLILLVVFGHAIEKYIDDNYILMIIYKYIYIFHMPLFVFISGYFSKNVAKCKKKAVSELLIPFFILNIIWYVILSIINKKIMFGMLSILIPGWTLWYLISLFWWRISLDKLSRIKYVFPLSIILGLIISIIPEGLACLSIGRTFHFCHFS